METNPYHSVCENISISSNECEELTTTEKVEKLTFPVQYISGATGSGNDWIMWLATLSSKSTIY